MIAVILGLIVGIVFGLTGGGGGVLTTPFLIYGLDIPVHQAMGITLITLSFTAIAGLFKRSRSVKIDWHVGCVISGVGIVTSWLGSKLNNYVSDEILSLSLAVCLILISMMLWHNASHKSKEDTNYKEKHYFKLCLIGFVAGFLNGLLGISGGVIVVTSLIIFMSYSMKRAVVASILVIAVNSTTSALTHYYYLPSTINGIAIIFIISSMCGMVVASHFSNFISESIIKKGLAVIVFFVGTSMLMKYFY